MRLWIYVFSAVALIAGIAGFTSELGFATSVSEILLGVFLVYVILAVVNAFAKRRSSPSTTVSRLR